MEKSVKVTSNSKLLQDIGVKPGWFVRAGTCLIWFEIEIVNDEMVIAAARDPSSRTEIYMVGDFFSSIEEVCEGVPYGHWIKLNREKNFYDKFYPEGKLRYG